MTKAYFYGPALLRLTGVGVTSGTGGFFDFDNDTFKVMLVKTDYALTALKLDKQAFVDNGSAQDVLRHEVAGGLGYQRVQLQLPTIDYQDDTVPDPGNAARFSDAGGAPAIFKQFTGTFQYAVLYKAYGTDSSSPLVMIVDFEREITVTDGNFVIQWAPEGIFRIRALQANSLPISAPSGLTFPIQFKITYRP